MKRIGLDTIVSARAPNQEISCVKNAPMLVKIFARVFADSPMKNSFLLFLFPREKTGVKRFTLHPVYHESYFLSIVSFFRYFIRHYLNPHLFMIEATVSSLMFFDTIT